MKKLSVFATSVVAIIMALGVIAPVSTSAASPCTPYKYKKVICAYRSGKQLSYYENGTRIMILEARYGGASTPTKTGKFTIQSKQSTSTLPWAMTLTSGQKIKYSKNFAYYGYKYASNGNIELRDAESAKILYDRAPVGTPVIVFDY